MVYLSYHYFPFLCIEFLIAFYISVFVSWFQVVEAETASKIDEFIDKLKALQRCEKNFTFIVEDITGNSFVENPFAPSEDPSTVIEHFTRTQEQNRKLGIYDEEATVQEEKDSNDKKEETSEGLLDLKLERWCIFP